MAVLTRVFLQENIWPFCRAKKSGRNNEVIVLPRRPYLYMAAQRYEISFRVLKYFSTREEKIRISKRPRNGLLCEHQ